MALTARFCPLPLTREASDWALRELLIRAGIIAAATPDVRVRYGADDATTTDSAPAMVTIAPCSPSAWTVAVDANARPLDRLQADAVMPPGLAPPFPEPVPVLFWGEGREGRPFAEVTRAGEVTCNVDIVASTAFMLSRWEEWKPFTPDEHGRFRAKDSVAFRQHFLDYPLVDVYGLILRGWIQSLVPGWTPPLLRLSVSLTHDIDSVQPFDTLSTAVRVLGSDLLKHRRLDAAWHHAADLVRQWARPARNSVFQGIQQLAALSVTHGLHSAFYFMTASKSRWNDGYDLGAPWVRPVLDDLQAQDLEIGFHAGYETLGNFPLLQEEKQRLDALIGVRRYGGRQHYLRFEAPFTWGDWDRAGFSYDATLGYAEADGFRCGTCWPFRTFDLKNNVGLALEERPFLSMDVTLRTYQERSPDQADEILMAWVERCRAVGGTFSVIWHNDMFIRERRDWALVYRRLVERLSAMSSC